MDNNKKNRAQLKAYFVKNAIPTEGQFADLIDGMLNQKDDGVAKPAGDPLSLEVAGGSDGTQKAINFYQSFSDPTPAWVLSLHPRTTPGDASTGRQGFDIGDGAGHSRLFIDQQTGNVGIGTIDPQVALDIAGSIRQRPGSFKVEGDADKWYPVIFADNGWADGGLELEISRTKADTDAPATGSLISRFRVHSENGGNGAAYGELEVHQSGQHFIGGFKNIHTSPKLVVWLKGGGITYFWRANHPARLEDCKANATTVDDESLAVLSEIPDDFQKDHYASAESGESELRPQGKTHEALLQSRLTAGDGGGSGNATSEVPEAHFFYSTAATYVGKISEDYNGGTIETPAGKNRSSLSLSAKNLRGSDSLGAVFLRDVKNDRNYFKFQSDIDIILWFYTTKFDSPKYQYAMRPTLLMTDNPSATAPGHYFMVSCKGATLRDTPGCQWRCQTLTPVEKEAVGGYGEGYNWYTWYIQYKHKEKTLTFTEFLSRYSDRASMPEPANPPITGNVDFGERPVYILLSSESIVHFWENNYRDERIFRSYNRFGYVEIKEV